MNVLDCTIRDGGYVTNNKWEREPLKKIVITLSSAGIKYIEIGNTLGLGMWHGSPTPHTDEYFMEACMPYKGDSMLGMFFIPGIGRKEDIAWFQENGGGFVRVGANATTIETTFDYISYAKSLGLWVSCNLMKTYTISKYNLVRMAKGVIDSGADCLYLVDSAGGMLPNQVSDYVRSIKDFYDISVGFHGHNNMQLANGNSFAAIQAGADFVDGTLQGLGRGAGNAHIESLVAICQKANIIPNKCNVLELADEGERVVGGLVHLGNTKREINIGINNFHDSFTGLLEESSRKYGVDPDLLMEEVCKINVINPSEELFDLAALRLKNGRRFDYAPAYAHKNI